MSDTSIGIGNIETDVSRLTEKLLKKIRMSHILMTMMMIKQQVIFKLLHVFKVRFKQIPKKLYHI